MSWGTESYPIDDNMYPFITDENVSQPEVRYIIDLDSNNEEGITDIKLPFNTSLSKFYQAKFDRVRTRGFIGPITEDEAKTIIQTLPLEQQKIGVFFYLLKLQCSTSLWMYARRLIWFLVLTALR